MFSRPVMRLINAATKNMLKILGAYLKNRSD